MENVWLHRYSIFLAACTLFLVVAGASVTSNNAGLAVPDWPLSYGRLMPPMEGGIFWEHGHRMVATGVGILTIIMTVWLWRSEKRRWMRRLGLGALGLVIAQGLLGGLTVILMLPRAISISHACLAEIFFSTTVAIAVCTSRSWLQGPRMVEDSGSPSIRTLALVTPVFVLAQVALGAAYRHRLLGILPHVIGALIVAGVIVMVTVFVLTQYGKHQALRRSATALLSITFFQVFLGIAAYMSRISTIDSIQPMPVMVLFTVLHVAVGAMTMAASVVLAIQVVRNVRRPVELASTRVAVTP